MPTSRSWQELGPYLDRALELTGEERAAWLAAVRERDPDLGADLHGLLDEHHAANEERFLEGRAAALPTEGALAGRAVGAYTLVSPIGYGGMGTVWLAERSDGRFDRRAAVKFLNVALAGRGEARFRREGRILGRLIHPHIAQLLDAGLTSGGQAYLVIEHVDGEPIDQYCDRRKLDVDARVRLVIDVLGAIAHAHANLVVHRDIKPSNVMVNADGQVKLLDFGIARLLEHDLDVPSSMTLTREGAGPFTPAYAAPEQLMDQAVTTATDVYALGVLLYLLLTGRHPAGDDLSSPATLVRAITDLDPARPSDIVVAEPAAGATANAIAACRATTPDRLRRTLRGDLDRIVGKTLKKAPQERYASATALAEDLRRYLVNEPVTARPDTVMYRAAKFVRRNRSLVALVAATSVAVLSGAAGTLVQAHSARVERDFALRQLLRAEAINDLNRFVLVDAAPSGKPFTVNDLLDRAEGVVARQRGGDDATRAHLLIAIGDDYLSMDEDGSGRRVNAEAYARSRGQVDPSVRARASCAYALAIGAGGQLPRAEALFQEGLRELPNDPLYALDRVFCLKKGSEVARLAGRSREGVERMRAAEAALEGSALRSEAGRLSVLMDLAESYRVAGQLRDANAAFAQAAASLTSLGRDNTQSAGTLFNNWALVLHQLGRPREAERLFWRGIAISSAGDAEQAVSPLLLINESRALRDLNRRAEAGDYAERGYAAAKRAEDTIVINQALLLRSSLARLAGDLDRASALLDEVEPRFKRTLPPGHVAFAALMRERALICLARSDFARGIPIVNEAVGLLEAAVKAGRQGREFLPQLLLVRSDLQRGMGRLHEAETDAARTVALLRTDIGSESPSTLIGLAYLALGRARRAQANNDGANAAFRTAFTQLNDALGPDHPDTRLAQQLAAQGVAPH